MIRISFQEMHDTIKSAFVFAGMPEGKADICARIHTETSRDGIYSHGLNRVERFVEYLNKNWVDADGEPSLEASLGAMEIFNGNLGPGVLNSLFAMDHAIRLAAEHGYGIVSMKNSTHWMRGGTYGWQAAERGFAAICWTNTESCMPAWGTKSEGIGNNPFIMAIPREEGPLVLDMAMSQYSYGKLQVTRLKNQRLPYPGGYDKAGNLTDLPGDIEETRRLLPTGYWKGSGFAIMLDLFSAMLSGGLTTAGVDKAGKGNCGRNNQVFIAFDPLKLNAAGFLEQAIHETIEQLKSSIPSNEGGEIFYPGEQSLKIRKENSELGIPVDDGVWLRVKELAGR